MRSTVVKFFAAALAAASVGAFAAPSYAGAAEDSNAQQGWCDIVPPFCYCNPQVAARCRCQPSPVAIKGREQSLCPVFKPED
jgi:hypothetical protein